MDTAGIRKAVKGLGILALDKAVGPLAATVVVSLLYIVLALLAAAMTAAVVLCIVDTGYLIHSGSHLEWLTKSQRYTAYAVAALMVVGIVVQAYKERGSYIERLKKVVDDNEKLKQKNARVELARKRLAEKCAYTDGSKNTKRSK